MVDELQAPCNSRALDISVLCQFLRKRAITMGIYFWINLAVLETRSRPGLLITVLSRRTMMNLVYGRVTSFDYCRYVRGIQDRP